MQSDINPSLFGTYTLQLYNMKHAHKMGAMSYFFLSASVTLYTRSWRGFGGDGEKEEVIRCGKVKKGAKG